MLNDEEYNASFNVRKFMANGNVSGKPRERLLEMMRKTTDNVRFIKAMEEYARICKKEGFTAPRQDNRR